MPRLSKRTTDRLVLIAEHEADIRPQGANKPRSIAAWAAHFTAPEEVKKAVEEGGPALSMVACRGRRV